MNPPVTEMKQCSNDKQITILGEYVLSRLQDLCKLKMLQYNRNNWYNNSGVLHTWKIV